MQKIHKCPSRILGGYGRRLKKKESSKGFTLVELIVVIVILAILAAILIPGLLKWIDHAKDKKYELEAREIALAAEAALTKVYADGVEVQEHYIGWLCHSEELHEIETPIVRKDWMALEAFKSELAKLTNADIKDIKRIYIYGPGGSQNMTEFPNNYWNDKPWTGNVCGFRIWFVASDGTKIRAFCRYSSKSNYGLSDSKDTDGWEIDKNPVIGSDSWESTWD